MGAKTKQRVFIEHRHCIGALVTSYVRFGVNIFEGSVASSFYTIFQVCPFLIKTLDYLTY